MGLLRSRTMQRGSIAIAMLVCACAAPEASSHGWIEIEARDGIGDVYVDARDQGPLREDLRIPVAVGSHVVELRRDHLVIASVTIEVRGGQVAAADLGRAAIGAWAGDAAVPAQLEVRSAPAAANTAIDGELRGLTPVQVVLAPGPHRVVLHAEGYDAHDEDIMLAPGSSAILEVSLRPTPR